MAVDTSPGFIPVGRRGGSYIPETYVKLKFKDTETLHFGDLVNNESGEVDLAATGDTAIAGVAMETKDGVDSTTEIEVLSDPDMVYSVYDPVARAFGATLDIAGATGAMTVAASSNADLIVVGGFLATERTLVMINIAKHALN
jgi:hypothetical protein